MAASPRTPSPVADARVGSRATVIAPAAPPLRVSRAAAKRVRIVSPRPPSFVIPVSVEDAPERHLDAPMLAAPKADQPWTTALARVPVQAP